MTTTESNGLNVELAEEVRREIAETAALFAAAQEAEDNRKVGHVRRLVDIFGTMHDSRCDRDRCHPDCPERIRTRALR